MINNQLNYMYTGNANLMHSSVQIVKKIKSYYFYPSQVLSVVLSNLVLPWACLVLLHIYTVSTTSVYNSVKNWVRYH